MHFILIIVLGRPHKCLYYKIISKYLWPTYNMEMYYQFQITDLSCLSWTLFIVGFLTSSILVRDHTLCELNLLQILKTVSRLQIRPGKKSHACVRTVCSVEWGPGQESSHCFGSSPYSTFLTYLFDCCFFFFKFHFIFNSVCACASVRVSVRVSAGAYRGQHPQIHPPGVTPGVSHLVAVLGTELGTSARAICALHHGAISAAPTILPVTFER